VRAVVGEAGEQVEVQHRMAEWEVTNVKGVVAAAAHKV